MECLLVSLLPHCVAQEAADHNGQHQRQRYSPADRNEALRGCQTLRALLPGPAVLAGAVGDAEIDLAGLCVDAIAGFTDIAERRGRSTRRNGRQSFRAALKEKKKEEKIEKDKRKEEEK